MIDRLDAERQALGYPPVRRLADVLADPIASTIARGKGD